LDGTLTIEEVHWENYLRAKPDEHAIQKIDYLYSQGHKIVIHTARPYSDWKVTVQWLKENGVRYHCLVMGKLRADLYIDNDSKRISDL
jgi:hydroxymethylpyrimidine pyrophosphatase-like HAD family hydrolase